MNGDMLDPSEANPKKLPTPPPNRQLGINMLDGRNKLAEYRLPPKIEKKVVNEQRYVPDTQGTCSTTLTRRRRSRHCCTIVRGWRLHMV
jgi:hypothetical protein